MTDEKSINNPYLDIVDAAVLGQGTDAQDVITNVLNSKISNELDDYSKEFANTMFDEVDEEEVDEEEVDEENDDDEDDETESEKD